MARLKELWDGLDARRRMIALLSVVAIAAAVFGISRVATAPSMAMLYSGLDATAAGEVVAELEAEGVAFQVDGAAIMVDAAARDRIRMQLAAKGLPAGGAGGLRDPRRAHRGRAGLDLGQLLRGLRVQAQGGPGGDGRGARRDGRESSVARPPALGGSGGR